MMVKVKRVLDVDRDGIRQVKRWRGQIDDEVFSGVDAIYLLTPLNGKSLPQILHLAISK